LIWPEHDGDFPQIVTDGDIDVYSVSPFNATDNIYLLGPGIRKVSREFFDDLICGDVTSFHILPRQMVEAAKAKRARDRLRRRRDRSTP
jgi:hypothetical protein